MPELPEIETIKRTLTPLLSGRCITNVALLRGDVIKHPTPEAFAQRIVGHFISELGRRGKYLLLYLDDGATMAAHLRMTGRLLCTPAAHPCLPHTHVVMDLDNGQQLRFADTRRFGCLWLIDKDEPDDFTGMAKLGVEPLSSEFSAEYLMEKLSKRKVAVKAGLLDQHVLAGLGNIYADETLFAAAVQPQRLCSSLSESEWRAIAAAIPPILESSIANNGTTFHDFLDGTGKEGENMPHLMAYGRAGQACENCGTLMLKTRVGGRGTCYCPNCQK